MDIHEHQIIRRVALQGAQDLPTVAHHIDTRLVPTDMLEDLCTNLDVDVVILGHQNIEPSIAIILIIAVGGVVVKSRVVRVAMIAMIYVVV